MLYTTTITNNIAKGIQQHNYTFECVSIYIYIYINIYIYIHTRSHMCIYITHVYISIYLSIYIFIYTYTQAHICVYTSHMCVYIYIYTIFPYDCHSDVCNCVHAVQFLLLIRC